MNKREHSRCYTTRQRRKPHLKHSLIEQLCLCFLKRKHLVTNPVKICDIIRNCTELNLLQVQQNPSKGVLVTDVGGNLGNYIGLILGKWYRSNFRK